MLTTPKFVDDSGLRQLVVSLHGSCPCPGPWSMWCLIIPPLTCFVVHKQIICDPSSFFKKAFTSNFREGNDQSMNLPKENPELIDCLIRWLYVQDFQKVKENNLGPEIDFYLLAGRLGIKQVKNQIIDFLVRYTNKKLGEGKLFSNSQLTWKSEEIQVD